MLAKCYSGAINGVEASAVEIEVNSVRSTSSFAIVGLPDAAVKEAKDRVSTALKNSGILAKGGTALVNDLYLVPVTVSSGQQKNPEDLDGRVKKSFKKLVLIDAMKIATEGAGNARTMNMVLAGALSTLCPFKEETWLKAMAEMLSGPKAKLLEVNKKAFALGRAAVEG